jgi:hypothetical protein
MANWYQTPGLVQTYPPRPLFRGARLRRTTDQTGVNTTAGVAVTWQAAGVDFDTDRIWREDTPTRLVIPQGVTLVSIVGQVGFQALTAATNITLTVAKNGSVTWSGRPRCALLMNTASCTMQVSSGPFEVNQSDYLELWIIHADTDVTFSADTTVLALSILQ